MKRKYEKRTQPAGRVYQVTITETRRRTVTVHESELKAPTPDDAEQTVRDWWHNGKIIPGTEAFPDVECEAREMKQGGDGNGRQEEAEL